MITKETLKSWFEIPEGTLSFPIIHSLTCGIFTLTLFRQSPGEYNTRLTARLKLDDFPDGEPLIDFNGTEQAVLEQAARILNIWDPDAIRDWADGLEKLHQPKRTKSRSALSRVAEN